MGIRRKMFAIIVSAFLGILLIFAFSGLLLLQGFSSAEDQEVRGNVLRAAAVFTSAVDNLAVKAHDWSAWDDTYAFIVDRNKDYVSSNLTALSLQSIGVNLMLFINSDGHLVESKHIDTKTLADVPLPPGLLPYLEAESPLMQGASFAGGVSKGVIELPEGLLMVAARPIQTSRQEGPLRGTLIFGKYVDQTFVDTLSKTIDFPLVLEPYTQAKGLTDFAQAVEEFALGGTTAVIPVDEASVAGYTVIPGVNGQPALVLRAVMDRHTLELGQKTVFTYLAFIFLTLTVISIGMWFLVDQFVLSRLARLTALVSASTPEHQKEIVLAGQDEFSHLARVINTLTTKLKLIDVAKTEFVSLASHQLRTPLTSISWYTEMLLAGDAGKLTPGQTRYLQEIYAGNRRMVALVNALLNVSRLELGTLVFEMRPTDVVAVAKSAVEEQQPQVSEKGLHFQATYEADLPLVSTDAKLFRMVIQNLLSNAIKYTPAGGTVSFSLALNTTREVLLITVTDTGYGIPKNQQDKIFTKLFRADNARAKEVEGTGLGLYIVKSVVEHSGGKVWFESEQGKGTTFFAAIPLGRRDTLKSI
ncbi:MAG: CHASE4 domain-containing protein [Candidatus Paceibacterota bacterium]